MADNETIADIIKKIRAEADSIEASARGSLKAGETWDGIAYTESDLEHALDLAETKRKEADRLEAALKREIGDAAKLREALKEIDRIVWDKSRHTKEEVDAHRLATETLTALAAPVPTAEKSSVVGDAAKLREALEELVSNIEMRASVFGIFSIIDRKTFLDAKAALAAPPRNCDRFATAEEADVAYRRFCAREIAKIPLDAVDYSKRVQIPTKDKWLFATAKEGGNK